MLRLAEASDCGLQRRLRGGSIGQSDSSLSLRMTERTDAQNDRKDCTSRHFDRAKASGEIPKSYALYQGDFSTALRSARNDA